MENKSFNEQSRNSTEFLSLGGNETFSTKCYELLKKVPAGKVTTYREIAF
jgi:O6-methylguanine-DNA--protein-cysteine methyltransferase